MNSLRNRPPKVIRFKVVRGLLVIVYIRVFTNQHLKETSYISSRQDSSTKRGVCDDGNSQLPSSF